MKGAVAGGLDYAQVAAELGVVLLEGGFDVVGLPEGEFAAAGTDYYVCWGHGNFSLSQ